MVFEMEASKEEWVNSEKLSFYLYFKEPSYSLENYIQA